MGWMNWTLPTIVALFALGGTIVSIVIFEGFKPPIERKGFLPIPTTPGDRLFISILMTFGIFFLYMAFFGVAALWVPIVICVVVDVLISIKG